MLNIKNLNKSYADKKILKDINLNIEPGDIYGFVGPNGAGKTTTIKCCVGLLDFESGEITIDGYDIKKNPLECKKQIAYIPDNPDLYEFFTGYEYINFISDFFKVSSDYRREKIEEYSKIFQLKNNLSDTISTYSHGMKQKLAIICALIHKPKLLILDEPFVGLDPMATHYLKEEFKNMCSEGSSVFFSSHVLEVVEKLCNKIAIIRKGEILIKGPTEEVKKDQSLENVFMEIVKHE